MPQWVKGQSGNLKGAPKKREQFAPVIRRVLAKRATPDDLTERELVVRALLDAAKAGDVQAIKYLIDRTDGLLPRPVEVSGEGGGPVRLALEWPEGGGE